MRITKLLLLASAVFALAGCGGGENTSSSSGENPYKFDVPSGDYMCDAYGMYNKVISIDALDATITVKTYASIEDLDNETVYASTTYNFDFKEYQFENKTDYDYVYGDRALVFENEDEVLEYGIYYQGNVGGRGDLMIYEYSVGRSYTNHYKLTPLSQCEFKALKEIPDGTYISEEKTRFGKAHKSEGSFYVEAIISGGLLQVNRKTQLSDPSTVVCTLKPLDLFGATCLGNAQERIFISHYDAEKKSFLIGQADYYDNSNTYFYQVEVIL